MIYPIGSIYLSATDTTENQVRAKFGNSTRWELISKDRYLYGYTDRGGESIDTRVFRNVLGDGTATTGYQKVYCEAFKYDGHWYQFKGKNADVNTSSSELRNTYLPVVLIDPITINGVVYPEGTTIHLGRNTYTDSTYPSVPKLDKPIIMGIVVSGTKKTIVHRDLLSEVQAGLPPIDATITVPVSSSSGSSDENVHGGTDTNAAVVAAEIEYGENSIYGSSDTVLVDGTVIAVWRRLS